MNKHLMNLFVPTLVVIWSFMYWMSVYHVSSHNKLLIRPICILMFTVYLYFVFSEYVAYQREIKSHAADVIDASDCAKGESKKIPVKEIVIIALVAVYLLIVPYLGFVLTSFAFMGCMLYILDVRAWRVIIAFSSICTGVLYLAFKVILMVPLPGGFMGF